MYLILCPTDKRIMHISTTIDYESNGNFILDSNIRVLSTIAECECVDSIPSYVEIEKYCYVNGAFIETIIESDPDDPTDETTIADMKSALEVLGVNE